MSRNLDFFRRELSTGRRIESRAGKAQTWVLGSPLDQGVRSASKGLVGRLGCLCGDWCSVVQRRSDKVDRVKDGREGTEG